MITVKELIHELQKLDQDAMVVVDGYEEGLSHQVGCSLIKIIKFYHGNTDGVYGTHSANFKHREGTRTDAVYIGTGRNIITGW